MKEELQKQLGTVQKEVASYSAAIETANKRVAELGVPISRTAHLNSYGPGINVFKRWAIQHDASSEVTHTITPGSSEDKWTLHSEKSKITLAPGPDGKLVKIQ
jgi:DNA repair exonuclease SbcCD ATPase subunit